MPYNPYQYGAPKPKPPTSMLNPYLPNPYAPPQHHPSLSPYPPSQHINVPQSSHVARSDLGLPEAKSPRSPFEDPANASYSPTSRTPSPATVAAEHARISDLAKKGRGDELLLDDPYSDAYKRPDSPATSAHAASMQGATFDVMKPEKTGQALLDDLAGLTSVEQTSTSDDSASASNSSQAYTVSQVLDLSEYGAPAVSASVPAATSTSETSDSSYDSSSVPSTQSQAGSSSHDIWSPSPSVLVQSSSSISSASSVSRFSPINSTSNFASLTNLDNSAPRSLSAQPPTNSGPTTVGTLIDLGSDSSRSQSPSLTANDRYGATSPSNQTTDNLLLADFGVAPSIAPTTDQAPKSSSTLIDTADFMLSPSESTSGPSLGSQLSQAQVSSLAPSRSDSDPLDFFAGPKPTQRMPDTATQDRLRRCFREFAGSSGTVEIGTAGIILENVLANIDGNKLEESFETQLRRLGLTSTVNEEQCFKIFVNVWNDCL